MDDLQREIILDHARNPRFPGVLEPADIDHEESNPLCGDRLRLTLQLDAEGRIVAVAWDAEGCAISQASASMLAEHILDMPLAEARSLTREEMLDMIGIPLAMNRVKCALLPLKALHLGSEGVV